MKLAHLFTESNFKNLDKAKQKELRYDASDVVDERTAFLFTVKICKVLKIPMTIGDFEKKSPLMNPRGDQDLNVLAKTVMDGKNVWVAINLTGVNYTKQVDHIKNQTDRILWSSGVTLNGWWVVTIEA